MNEDRYPEDSELLKIKNWKIDDFTRLFEYIKSLWAYPDYFRKTGAYKYSLSTGGWSGNEDIIGSMQENYVFWGTCWMESKRGGHYKFEIPKGLR
jgi:hypothetical protein